MTICEDHLTWSITLRIHMDIGTCLMLFIAAGWQDYNCTWIGTFCNNRSNCTFGCFEIEVTTLTFIRNGKLLMSVKCSCYFRWYIILNFVTSKRIIAGSIGRSLFAQFPAFNSVILLSYWETKNVYIKPKDLTTGELSHNWGNSEHYSKGGIIQSNRCGADW